jgi:hypothetical protein
LRWADEAPRFRVHPDVRHALGVCAGILFTAAVLTMPLWMILTGLC